LRNNISETLILFLTTYALINLIKFFSSQTIVSSVSRQWSKDKKIFIN